jgi:aminoglycoside phosphotransferase family enzyme/predicted kinase
MRGSGQVSLLDMAVSISAGENSQSAMLNGTNVPGRVFRAASTPARRGQRGFRRAPTAANRLKMQEPPSARTQDAVFGLLSDPASYGLPGAAKIGRHQTHAAIVFLAGDLALKVKRAVRYPFLDFSTLEKRKIACEAELAVNRKFAPRLYRRLVPITREANGALAVDGAGEPVEWAVEMARFEEDGTLDRLAERGKLDERLLAELAVAVAVMHERAEPVEPGKWIGALEGFIGNNSSIFRRHPELFGETAVVDLERRSRTALKRLQPLLIERGEQGLIRRGHGDLHLGNIAVVDGEPIAFDALEFDPVIASGDLLYDLAFLLMDLLDFDRHAAANQVLNGYYAAARRDADYDGIAALPFFMSLRAAIRAMTTASRLDVTKNAIAQSARRYFDLAAKLLTPAKPTLLGIGGLSGTGKTVLARSLAPSLPPAPGALVFRSDIERKALYGVGEHERLPSSAYRAEVSERVYRIIIDKAARVARAGHSAIVDAVFALAEERAVLEAAAAAIKVDFRGLFLTADLPTRLQRVGGRAADASDADAEVARKQQEYMTGSVAWTHIDAAGSPAQTLANARAAVA